MGTKMVGIRSCTASSTSQYTATAQKKPRSLSLAFPDRTSSGESKHSSSASPGWRRDVPPVPGAPPPGQTHQYQLPGKGVFDPHQIRGKAAVGVDGRELRKVHEVQHQPVEEDQSALEQKLMPPAYAGELLQDWAARLPRSFSVTDGSFIYPFVSSFLSNRPVKSREATSLSGSFTGIPVAAD